MGTCRERLGDTLVSTFKHTAVDVKKAKEKLACILNIFLVSRPTDIIENSIKAA